MYGNDALKTIRRALPYKDIIFYSANNARLLSEKVYQANVDGIFCSSRDDLAERGYLVFENLVKKVLDIDHTRGIIIGATSDIEIIIKDCLRAIHSKCAINCNCSDIIHEKIALDKERICKNADKALSITDFDTILDDKYIRGAYFLSDLLISLLDKNTFASERDALIKYKNEILQKRNQLAHARLLPAESSIVFEDSRGDIINEEDMRALRCSLIEHRKNIRLLAKKLGINDALLFPLERVGSA